VRRFIERRKAAEQYVDDYSHSPDVNPYAVACERC
jgi:hypothetical protein